MSFYRNKNSSSGSSEATPLNIYTDKFTATANQKEFTLTHDYVVGKDKLLVYVGGVLQTSPENYTETSKNSIAFIEGVGLGVSVIVKIYF